MSPAPQLVTRLQGLVRKAAKTVPHELRAQARSQPIEADLVVYESFAGNGMLCNPEAIFRGLLDDPRQQHLRHVWVLDDPRRHPEVTREFGAHPRVRFVRRGSLAYERALATAGLLVNNATFPPTWGKRPGQVYLNTWHGTPLKTMGYDEAQGGYGARNVLRNFLMADYLLSTSEFMSSRMYEQAYRLVNVGQGEIVEAGYPRTDAHFADAAFRQRTRDRLRAAGVTVRDDDAVVLLAPTWKGESFHNPRNDAAALAGDVAELQAALPPGHRVLLKVHQQVAAQAEKEPALAGHLVPNGVPANSVLALTDVLVTDYSSIFFDFLSTGRPVLFHTPDRAEYEGYRGCYLTEEELPGPRASTIEQLAVLVRAVGTGAELDPTVSHATAYAAARQRFAPHDDGGATQRVIDLVLRGRRDSQPARPVRRDGRRTLLVYLGGMMSNGITSSALNLLRTIDHRRWDVSVVLQESPNPERRRNAANIDPRVRQLYRAGGLASSKLVRGPRRKLMRGHLDQLDAAAVGGVDAQLALEWQRVAGTSRFDHVIDFSGYSPEWTFLLANAPGGSHSVWLHNDLRADQMREVHGRRPHEANLRGVFTSYARFDHLVSVSEALRDINAEHLAAWAAPEKFVSARNTIDVQRIVTGASEGDVDGVVGRVTRGDPEAFTFVSVGRLSPEKNHERLIRAFARARDRHPQARLVVLGDGPLRRSLQKLARELGLDGVVLFAGAVHNPWGIMADCSCFVLSSDYEGQPMVILEARILGLPVVSTAFGSVGSALDPGSGLIVDRSCDALADAMTEAIEGRVPTTPLDGENYNAQVIREFERAIGAEGP